ncbi:MAG: T9SS type A sorting domain-containing protein, partial [Rhodothermales bacterium]
DGNWSAIDPRNDLTSYVSSQRLRIFRTMNGGQSARDITPPASATTGFIAPFVLAPSDPKIIYAGRDVVFKSLNQGNSWQRTNGGRPLDGNPVLTLAVSPLNPDVVYAATAPVTSRARLFRSLDGGRSWENITGPLPDRYPMDIAVDPVNTATVYVVFSGYGTPHVFRSMDGGNTWGDISAGLPDLPTSAVVIDPQFPEHVYVGNDLGVYLSKDGGDTWMLYSEGLPEAVIAMDLSISPANRMVRLATHGNGVYERSLASVDDPPAVATGFALLQNYPNPFRDHTVVVYEVPEAQHVRLAIYDVRGRKVATLVDGQVRAGRHAVPFDGGGLASGIYVARLLAGEASASRTMVVAR